MIQQTHLLCADVKIATGPISPFERPLCRRPNFRNGSNAVVE